MIVAAAIGRENAPQHAEPFKIWMDLPKRRAHQRSNEDNITAAFRSREAQELPDLADMQPVMWKTLYGGALGSATQWKQNDRASTRRNLVCDRQRQAAATT
jgi:hypothetical protein